MNGNHGGSQATAHVVLNSTPTCRQLPQRSISNNWAQSHLQLDSPTSQSMPKCWGWTTPSIPIQRNQTIQSTYRKNEKEKRRQYEKRITNIEHGSFTPLVFYNRLAPMISQKHLSPYCETMKMIQCKLAFSLVDLAGLCLRGARSALHRSARLNLNDTPIDMIVSEGRLWTHFCFQWQMHLLTPELCNLMCLDIFATCMCFVCVIGCWCVLYIYMYNLQIRVFYIFATGILTCMFVCTYGRSMFTFLSYVSHLAGGCCLTSQY